MPLPRDELAEILVSRDQHAFRGSTSLRNDFINDPRRHLGHLGNLVAIESKAFDNLTVDAFISQESHRGPPDPPYADVKNAVLGIFEANNAAAIPLKTRLGEGGGLRDRQVPGDRLRVPAFCGRWRGSNLIDGTTSYYGPIVR